MADMASFHAAVAAWAAGDHGPDVVPPPSVRTVVLLEGLSDAAAVEALAAGHERDLAAEGICVLPMGGAMNAGRFARLLGPSGLGLRLTGLCDVREHDYFARGWAAAGADPQEVFVCAADLEDELIRALGVDHVKALIETEGDLRPLETFLQQPAQRDRTPQQQLRRFLGTKKGRKIHYGRTLVEALTPDRTPAPLAALFATL